MNTLSASAIRDALQLRDLTDPSQGQHAMQLLLDRIERALADRWDVSVRRERAHPIVSIAENYDRLLVPGDAVAREARYTRYVNDHAVRLGHLGGEGHETHGEKHVTRRLSEQSAFAINENMAGDAAQESTDRPAEREPDAGATELTPNRLNHLRDSGTLNDRQKERGREDLDP